MRAANTRAEVPPLVAPELLLPAIPSSISSNQRTQGIVVRVEEPAALNWFGPSYEEYRRTVARWFPRLRS